ncbi:sulfatase-like hydrolase/transferase [Vibrio rhizosphaerae]|uniref:sulfatase-like hydrolase/transferase n=1 Tax=Vibrio rhizosphaerae TaxID=398736 RepID=UPI000691F913|nr:sulfatase-like hydrolase/transferase [Vibrio rhizosphaerae]
MKALKLNHPKAKALSLCVTAALSLGLSGNSFAAEHANRVPTDHPNVIVVLVDDMGVEGISHFGGEYYSPNVDQLARSGVSFDNAHAMPLSSPTRTRLMTGIENRKNYKAFGYLGPDQITFGNTFKEAGYATAIAGKWQLSGNGFDGLKGITPSGAGFEESFVWFRNTFSDRGSRYWAPTLFYNDKKASFEEGFGPDMIQTFAKHFINKNQEKPFFLYYPMMLTHDPYVVTPDSMNAEGEKNKFSGMVSYMDKQVGDLVKYVDSKGLLENTIFVFTADNGTLSKITSYRNGHKVKGGKGFPTLNGTHVPMVVSWKGQIQPKQHVSGLFDIMDVYPTITDLAGIKIKQEIDGISQAPVLKGKKASVRDTIFMHYAPMWNRKPASFVFNQDWKLYKDGKFVKLNPGSGEEVLINSQNQTKESEKQLKLLKAAFAKEKDTPLEKVTAPFCKGHKSLKPGVDSTIAGCDRSKLGLRSITLDFLE